jgi:cytochrome c oxidase subunit 4
MSTASSDHVVSIRLYLAIFATLIILTALTVWVAFIDLGPLNLIVALGVAVTKATLVVLFFMHVKYSSRLTWLVVVSGFFFLAIMLGLTMSDVVSRGWLGTPGG